jgi:hypothetical protein
VTLRTLAVIGTSALLVAGLGWLLWHLRPSTVGAPASITDHPSHVAVYVNGGYRCGGTLIADRWVLTAGHCVEPGNDIRVVAGRSGLTHVVVNNTFPGCSSYGCVFKDTTDLALIRVDKVVAAAKATLASKDAAPDSGVIVGWGLTKSAGVVFLGLDRLRRARVHLLPAMTPCKSAHIGLAGSDRCAAPEMGYPCRGDSGGGLVIDTNAGRRLYAVLSGARGCGVFARVFGSWRSFFSRNEPLSAYVTIQSRRRWICDTANLTCP